MNVVRIGVEGGELAVAVAGLGACVVMHPSLGRWAKDFDQLIAALVNDYRTVAIDPRGVDKSIGTLRNATLRSLADDVIAVLDALEIDAAFFVGHAFGNRVMRQAATVYPHRCRGIVLLGAGGRVHGDEEARGAINRCFDFSLPIAERRAAIATGFFAPGNDPSVWDDGWFPAAKEAQQRAMLSANADEWWNAGDVPMLVVQGLQDRAAPPANGRLLAAERTAPTELVEIDGAGHALLPERPAEIAAAVRSFLSRS